MGCRFGIRKPDNESLTLHNDHTSKYSLSVGDVIAGKTDGTIL